MTFLSFALTWICSGAVLYPQATTTSGAPPATGFISGRVVDASTGRPVPGATVTLSFTREAVDIDGNQLSVIDPAAGNRTGVAFPQRIVTADDGAFVFQHLPPGSFAIDVAHTAYLPAGYGQRSWDAQRHVLTLTADERITDVALQIWKQGVLAGRVVDELGDPVVRVAVRALRRSPLAGRYRYAVAASVTTDDHGDYRIVGLKPGDYLVAVPSTVVTIPDSIAESYRLASQDRAARFTQALSRSGAPMPSADGAGVSGHLMSVEWRGPVGAALPATANRAPALLVYPTAFYPSAASATSATALTVESGRETNGIVFELHPVKSLTVSGTLRGPDGSTAHTGLRLVSTGVEPLTTDRGFESALTATDEHGAFTFLGVPPGQYLLKALIATNGWTPPLGSPESLLTLTADSQGRLYAPSRPANEPLLWANVTTAVAESDVADLTVELLAGARISGRLEFEGPSAKPAPRSSMFLSPIDNEREGSSAFVVPNAEWRFTTAAYAPGRYLFVVSNPGGPWSVKAVMVDGRDVFGGSVEVGTTDVTDVVVIVTDQPRARLSGTIQRPMTGPDRDLEIEVVAFPADVESWIQSGMNGNRAQISPATRAGAFALTNLRPDDYLVAAVSGDRRVDLQDPDFVRAVAPHATKIKLGSGEQRAQALPVTRIR